MDKKKAYTEILEVMSKHKDVLNWDSRIDLQWELENRLTLCDLEDRFGIKMKPDSNPNWTELGWSRSLGLWGIKHNRIISWSDTTEQPVDEYLYVICFPTGAYIFGKACPTETFQSFFEELKSYNPKYIDSANKALYFTSETAQAIHEDFDGIFAKHKAKVQDELKGKEIIALKEKLSKLEGGDYGMD